MREHLLHCLEQQRFTPFPRQQKPARFSRGHDVDIYVFWSCSMPESFDNMIQCDLSEQWLHMKCEKLNSSPEADEWLCRDYRPPEFKRVKVTV